MDAARHFFLDYCDIRSKGCTLLCFPAQSLRSIIVQKLFNPTYSGMLSFLGCQRLLT